MNQLKNKFLTVTVALKGAEIKEIKYGNIELLHNSNPEYWNRSAPYLFPNIGVIKDNYTIFDGVKFPLTKHGFLRDFDFNVINQTDDKMVLELKENEKTLSLYPFKFKVEITYQLKEKSLLTSVKITNCDKKSMPFHFGLHPAFKVPFVENTNFEDYNIVFDSEINAKIPTFLKDSGLIDWSTPTSTISHLQKLKLNYEDYRNDVMIINPMPNGKIKIVAPNQSEIVIDAPDFTTLGIWTPYPKKCPFICVEPWIGYADDVESNHEFCTKKDLIVLQPNEIYETTFSYTFNIK